MVRPGASRYSRLRQDGAHWRADQGWKEGWRGGHGERGEGMGQQRVHRSLSAEHKFGISASTKAVQSLKYLLSRSFASEQRTNRAGAIRRIVKRLFIYSR